MTSITLQQVYKRKAFLFSYLRQYVLFFLTGIWRSYLFPYPREIEVGENVRIQSLHCLRAESPSARISVGDDSILYENARLEAFGHGVIEVGEKSILGDIRITSRGKVSLGKRVITSWNVFLQDYDPHPVDASERREQVESMVANFRPFKTKEEKDYHYEPRIGSIKIGDDVWIGANVTILRGVTIGSGSVVGAGAVVVEGEYPPNSKIVGNPARVVGS